LCRCDLQREAQSFAIRTPATAFSHGLDQRRTFDFSEAVKRVVLKAGPVLADIASWKHCPDSRG
jgi:hypothetical protein